MAFLGSRNLAARTLLVLVLCLLLNVAFGQNIGSNEIYEQTGSFYDFNSGEFLTVERVEGKVKIFYSNGVKPFEELILQEEVKSRCCCDTKFCINYFVCFKNNPTIKYVLKQEYWEGIRLECYDKSNKNLNSFTFFTEDIVGKPDAIIAIALSWNGSYYSDNTKGNTDKFVIDIINNKTILFIQTSLGRVDLLPESYIPSKTTLLGKTSLGDTFEMRLHRTLPRYVSIKIYNMDEYKEERWFEFGSK